MTEAEWLRSDVPDHMLGAIERGSERKLRLFAVACWQQIGELLVPEARHLLTLAERHADEAVSEDRRIEAIVELVRKPRSTPDWRGRVYDSRWVLDSLATLTDTTVTEDGTVRSAPQPFGPTQARDAADSATDGSAVREQYLSFGPLGRLREWTFHLINGPDMISYGGEFQIPSHERQCSTLRDIFGNPFHPVTLDLRWRSETAVALATGIYTERAFDRMPILADALEEAGCDNADILTHCRGDGPHVRGCWVVDLLLGKE